MRSTGQHTTQTTYVPVTSAPPPHPLFPVCHHQCNVQNEWLSAQGVCFLMCMLAHKHVQQHINDFVLYLPSPESTLGNIPLMRHVSLPRMLATISINHGSGSGGPPPVLGTFLLDNDFLASDVMRCPCNSIIHE